MNGLILLAGERVRRAAPEAVATTAEHHVAEDDAVATRGRTATEVAAARESDSN